MAVPNGFNSARRSARSDIAVDNLEFTISQVSPNSSQWDDECAVLTLFPEWNGQIAERPVGTTNVAHKNAFLQALQNDPRSACIASRVAASLLVLDSTPEATARFNGSPAFWTLAQRNLTRILVDRPHLLHPALRIWSPALRARGLTPLAVAIAHSRFGRFPSQRDVDEHIITQERFDAFKAHPTVNLALTHEMQVSMKGDSAPSTVTNVLGHALRFNASKPHLIASLHELGAQYRDKPDSRCPYVDAPSCYGINRQSDHIAVFAGSFILSTGGRTSGASDAEVPIAVPEFAAVVRDKRLFERKPMRDYLSARVNIAIFGPLGVAGHVPPGAAWVRKNTELLVSTLTQAGYGDGTERYAAQLVSIGCTQLNDVLPSVPVESVVALLEVLEQHDVEEPVTTRQLVRCGFSPDSVEPQDVVWFNAVHAVETQRGMRRTIRDVAASADLGAHSTTTESAPRRRRMGV
jgi:hypothetical protein